jgi:hypothetical protein
VSEARSINHAEILTARTDASAEAAEVTATEAAAAEAAAAPGAAAKAAADALGARAALAPELPKEPGGGAGGMAEDAEEISGRPVLSVGAREESKTQGVAQQRGSERGSPGRMIDTDQNFKTT